MRILEVSQEDGMSNQENLVVKQKFLEEKLEDLNHNSEVTISCSNYHPYGTLVNCDLWKQGC